jgi:hypothetical protein
MIRVYIAADRRRHDKESVEHDCPDWWLEDGCLHVGTIVPSEWGSAHKTEKTYSRGEWATVEVMK